MNPINKQIKLETKARTNHSANENRNSAANLKSPRQKITLGSKYNAFSARHYLFAWLFLFVRDSFSFSGYSVTQY
jgi:hypothetical protein